MVNSTYGVRKDYHLMLTDGLVFSRKTTGPEEGHARWKEELEKTPEDEKQPGMCRELWKTQAEVGAGTLREEVSHQQLLMLIFMGHA